MEKVIAKEKSDYLKAIIGALIFLTIAILLTSKWVNLSEKSAILLLQFFLIGLVLMAISLKGYYFTKPNKNVNLLDDDLLEKALIFSISIIPTSLIFFVNPSFQEFFFFLSFTIGIGFVFIYEISFNEQQNNYLFIFLTTIWALLGVIVLVRQYNILPARFFNELSFLQLDTIKIIRIILLVVICIHLTIISFVEAIKPENKILEANPIPQIPMLKEIDSYHFLLRPVLWLGYLAVIFLNIGIFLANLILAALRIIIDSVLRFGRQVILNIIKLLSGWYSIIFFILLYLVCFSIPFIIKVNSPFLLNYIRGNNTNFNLLLSQAGILLFAVFLFRLFVTFIFCRVQHKPSTKPNLMGWAENFFNALFGNIIPPFLNGKAYIENFTPIIYCLVFYSFFTSLASIILTGISNYWNSLFEIEGYLSIGALTKYCGFLIVLAILVVIPFIISKSKFGKKTITEEDSYFEFVKLDFPGFWRKSWILLLFICLVTYLYIFGIPPKLRSSKPAAASPQSIEKISPVIMKDSGALKKNDEPVYEEMVIMTLNNLMNNALINLKAQEYDEAIKQLDEVLKRHQLPKEIENQISDIKIYIKAREDNEAIKLLKELVPLDMKLSLMKLESDLKK